MENEREQLPHSVCPRCGYALVDINAKMVCPRCRSLAETCCEGGQTVKVEVDTEHKMMLMAADACSAIGENPPYKVQNYFAMKMLGQKFNGVGEMALETDIELEDSELITAVHVLIDSGHRDVVNWLCGVLVNSLADVDDCANVLTATLCVKEELKNRPDLFRHTQERMYDQFKGFANGKEKVDQFMRKLA